MRLDKTSIGGPHDLLELPELAEETRVAVVDLFGIFLELRVVVALDVPDTVGESTTLGASDFLLLKAPVRKLDLVREESAASHDVHQLELGLNCTDARLCFCTIGQGLYNFNLEKIVGIALEALIAVS